MPHPNIFFNVPLPVFFEQKGMLESHPVNVELFADGDVLETLAVEEADSVRKTLDAHSLGRRVHGPYSEIIPGAVDPRVRRVALDRLTQALSFTERVGADAMVFHSGFDTLNHRGAEDAYRGRLVPVLRELAGRAAEKGITLLLENVYEPAPDLLLESLSEAGAENMRLCFDAAHHRVFGGDTAAAWLERCAPLVDEVHISDNLGGWDDHLAPGHGTIDYPAFFGLLKSHGISPVFTFEPHSVEAFIETLSYIGSHPEYFAA